MLQEIDVAGSQSLDLDTKWLGNALKGTLKTTQYTGRLRFDAAVGRLHSASVQMDLAGTLKFGNANAADMKIAYRHELELELQP